MRYLRGDDIATLHGRGLLSEVHTALLQEGFRRRGQGYFKGALDPRLTAIADWTTWHELMLMRYTDEAVRWRLTEFIVSSQDFWKQALTNSAIKISLWKPILLTCIVPLGISYPLLVSFAMYCVDPSA